MQTVIPEKRSDFFLVFILFLPQLDIMHNYAYKYVWKLHGMKKKDFVT